MSNINYIMKRAYGKRQGHTDKQSSIFLRICKLNGLNYNFLDKRLK